METAMNLFLDITFILCLWSEFACSNMHKVAVKMPGVRPTEPDSYFCTAVKLSNQAQYIVHFEPNASMDVAHHMLLFGCQVPASRKKYWKCMSMSECLSEPKILYAWGRNAPGRDLPKDVGFKVGGSTTINYLVLQVHYGNVQNILGTPPDHSGFILHTTTVRQKYTAGIYLMWGASANIHKESRGEHVNIACTYDDDEPIYGFAFRTHTHTLGRVVTGYRVRNGQWKLLGKGNPQAPQAFYPMKEVIQIRKGDVVAGRCTYDTIGHKVHKTIHMGATAADEMCNFYLMYYQKSSVVLDENMDCGMHASYEIIQQFPKGSDTALPKGVNYQSFGVSTDVKSNLNKEHESMTPMPTVSQTVNTVRTEDLSVEGIHDKDLFAPFAGKSSTMISTPANHQSWQEELHVVSGWPKLSDNVQLGQVSGVSVMSTGDVVIFHRASREWDSRSFEANHRFRHARIRGPIKENTILVMSPNFGRLIWHGGDHFFYLPHGLTVDHENNLWVTDVAMHQVFKFLPMKSGKGWNRKPVLTLGKLLQPGSDGKSFCKPTDVAVSKNGEFFVSDGYCNSRIMKYSPEGKLLHSWGTPSKRTFGGSPPAPGTLYIPHSLALDDDHHRLYVADRENGRIQCFDTKTGFFQKEISLPEFEGRVFAVDFSKRHGGVLHVVNGPALDSRRVVTVQGLTVSAKDGKLLNAWPAGSGKGAVALSQPHDVASSPDGSAVYVVEIEPKKIWKFVDASRVSIPGKPKGIIVQDNNKFSTATPIPFVNLTGPVDTVLHVTTNKSSSTRELNITSGTKTPPPNSSPAFVNIYGPSPTSDPVKGVIPALIILSVLAVPIIFLLCISIVLRVRAYRRERYRHVKFGEIGMKGDLAVSRTKGWCSYLNCCNRRNYGFDKVTLNDFYSDSDSEGI